MMTYTFYNGISRSYVDVQSFGSTTNPATVTITALSTNSVKGTFKGHVGNLGSPITLNNGVFNVSF